MRSGSAHSGAIGHVAEPVDATRRCATSRAKQLRQRHARIGRAHEGLAHQKRVDTGRAHAQHVVAGRGCRSRSPADGRPARRAAASSVVSSDTSKVLQVAVVDAHQRRLELAARAPVRRASCTSTSTAMSRLRAIASRSVICASSRQAAISNMAVGAHGARLVDLVRVHHEILAQHRQLAGGTGLLEVVHLPWKNCTSVSTDKQAAPCSA